MWQPNWAIRKLSERCSRKGQIQHKKTPQVRQLHKLQRGSTEMARMQVCYSCSEMWLGQMLVEHECLLFCSVFFTNSNGRRINPVMKPNGKHIAKNSCGNSLVTTIMLVIERYQRLLVPITCCMQQPDN